MKITKKKSANKIFNFVNEEALAIAKQYGMKETVQLFESALIALAIHEQDGNNSSASRSLKTPVTTLGSRKLTLKVLVEKMEKFIKLK
ncbi:MAG: hypothetical protein AB8G05_01525 [Oligoflexales bacterium]